MSTAKLTPSYYGYVGSTKDALLIIQAIVDKQLDLVSRRPHERERPSLIKSGNVFVFIEEKSGIKRWTDGIAWSPSRILGRFLVYRELDKHSLSEKDDKKKKKRKTSTKSEIKSSHDNIHDSSIGNVNNPNMGLNGHDDYNNKNLVGSLVTSYVFKDQGLIKKTLSLTSVSKDVNLDKKEESQTIHLISYYNADDVLNGTLQRPSESDLKNITISNTLCDAIKESSLGGKIPIEDEAYYFLDNNYQLQNMSLLQQPPMNRPHNQLPPPQSGLNNQFISGQQKLNHLPPALQNTNGPQNYHSYKSDDYLAAQPHQPYGASNNGTLKREDDPASTGGNLTSNELTFINPFTNSSHGPNGGPLSVPVSNSGQSGSGSTLSFYNNGYMLPQQYPTGNFLPHQIPDSNSNNAFSHIATQSPVQPPSQSHAPSQSQPQHFAPFPPQHLQQMYPPQQQQQQQQQHHYGSILASSDQFSVSGNSNGSVSSIGSGMLHGGSGIMGGVAQKNHFRTGSGGANNGGWFTTTTNNNGLNSGGYVNAAPAVLNQDPLATEASNFHHHIPSNPTITGEDAAGQPSYVTGGTGYTRSN